MKLISLSLAFTLIVSILDISPVYAYDSAQIQASLKAKDYKKVVEILSPEVEKLDRQGLFALAKAYSAQKKSEAAIKVYTAALSTNPKDVEAKTLIGAEQMVSGKEKEAMMTLKEALELKSDFVPAYKLLIRIYEKKENKYELRLLYQDLVEKVGPKPEYFSKLCELSAISGLYDIGEKYCRQSIEKNPKEANGYVYLGMTLKETGKVIEADMTMKKAADDFPKSSLAQLTFADHQAEKKNFISAYTYYKRAIEADAKSKIAYLGLAQSALEIQKYQESLDAFLKLCKLDKNNVAAFRKATNTLRTMRIEEWLKKFETQSENCD